MNIHVHKKLISLYEQLIQSNKKLIAIEDVKFSTSDNFGQLSLINEIFAAIDSLSREMAHYFYSKDKELSNLELEKLEKRVINLREKIDAIGC